MEIHDPLGSNPYLSSEMGRQAKKEPDRGAGNPEDTILLNIMYTNDLHGALRHRKEYTLQGEGTGAPGASKPAAHDPDYSQGGLPSISALVKSTRESAAKSPNIRTIFVDTGDKWQGDFISEHYHGDPMVESMNEMGYDAGTVGNHDFDQGPAELARIQRSLNFPTVCANLVDAATGKTPDFAEPYFIKDLGGVKVGITGLITPEMKSISRPEFYEGLDFLPPEAVLKDVVSEMRARGAEVVVVLSHMGSAADKALAKSVRGVDIIIGGHNHEAITMEDVAGGRRDIRDAEADGRSEKRIDRGQGGMETPVAQAGWKGEWIGKAVLTFSKSQKKVLSYSSRLIPNFGAQIPGDEKVEQICRKYETQAADLMSREVGSVQEAGSRDNARDSRPGNVLTDAMRKATGAQIALINSSVIRTDLPGGTLRMQNLFDMLPFDNRLVSISLKGRDLKRILEKSISAANDNPASSSNFLQISGLQVTYDPSRPKGEQVLEIRCNGKPLSDERAYTVATSDYLNDGSLGYEEFKNGGKAKPGKILKDVLIDYLKSSAHLTIPEGERIRKTS